MSEEARIPIQPSVEEFDPDTKVPIGPISTQTEPPKAKKSDIRSWFNVNFIELMAKSPQNPIVRGHIMARVKTMPPVEANTFDKLLDWIEFNFEFVKPARPAPGSASTFDMDFNVVETQIGACRYSVTATGNWTESTTLEEILERIDNGDSAEEIISWIENCAVENQEADLEQSDDYEYSDYNLQYSDATSVERSASYNRVEGELFDFLDEHAPEAAETLRDRG